MEKGARPQTSTEFESAVRESGAASGGLDRELSARAWVLVGLAFCAIALAIYWPSLRGAFIGDDWLYIVDNPFITSLRPQALAALFDPGGAASLYVVNYTPIHLLAHALERAAFGPDVLGYHLVNLLLHLLVSGLLIALLRSSGIPDALALLAGLIFLVHPANVEAVAWISQLKTTGSTAFALTALLILRRNPGGSAMLFALGLLTKPSAVFALPMAAALVWSQQLGGRHWRWVGAWLALFVLYAVPEFAAFEFGGRHIEAAYEDSFVHLRSMAAIGTRYVVMAATSFGVSTLQQQRPVESMLDPWWLAALPLAAYFLWRIAVSLGRRRDEAAWWLAAAAAFAPVSQLFPFIHPVADHYLYPILPGLLGGASLAWVAGRSRAVGPRVTRGSLMVVLVVGTLASGAFAVRSHARAALWQGEEYTLRESAANYPDGLIALSLSACEAAQQLDPKRAVALLRRAVELSPASHRNYFSQACLVPLREDPLFLSFVREQAALRIEFAQENGLSTQQWLRSRANDHLLLGDLDGALDAFEQARRVGGPRDSEVLGEIEATREMLRAKRRGEPIPQLFNIPLPAMPDGSESR